MTIPRDETGRMRDPVNNMTDSEILVGECQKLQDGTIAGAIRAREAMRQLRRELGIDK